MDNSNQPPLTPALKPLPPATLENVFPPNKDYVYFENCQQHPFRYVAQKFEPVNAWWLAEAALLAYATSEFSKPRLEMAGLREVRYFGDEHRKSTQCFVAHNDDCILVSFRGTQVYKPGTKGNLSDTMRAVLKDIYTDLNFRLVESRLGGCVHRGFSEGLEEVWPRLDPHLRELKQSHPARTLWFTGHSLGAALATLAALAARRFGSVQGLYTFGSPRVGDADFGSGFQLPGWRFVNNNDIVTAVPPAGPYAQPRSGFGQFKHVGQLKYIHNDGHVSDNPSLEERLADGLRGTFSRALDALSRLASDDIWEIPIDQLTDHAPLYYAIHAWNHYVKG